MEGYTMHGISMAQQSSFGSFRTNGLTMGMDQDSPVLRSGGFNRLKYCCPDGTTRKTPSSPPESAVSMRCELHAVWEAR